MDQRLSLVTLGVKDLSRSTAFFEALGWKRSMKEAEGVSFFQCGSIAFGLFPRADLIKDIGLQEDGTGFGGIAIAYNARTKQEVDAVLEEVRSLGAEVVKTAKETFWGGYSGYFQDIDGYIWEVAWNPGFKLDDAGAIELPD